MTTPVKSTLQEVSARLAAEKAPAEPVGTEVGKKMADTVMETLESGEPKDNPKPVNPDEFVPKKTALPIREDPHDDESKLLAYYDPESDTSVWPDGTPLNTEQQKLLDEWEDGEGDYADSDLPPYAEILADTKDTKPAKPLKSDPEQVRVQKRTKNMDAVDDERARAQELKQVASSAPQIVQELWGDDTTVEKSEEGGAFLKKVSEHLTSMPLSTLQKLAKNFLANPKLDTAKGIPPDVEEEDMRLTFRKALTKQGMDVADVATLFGN